MKGKFFVYLIVTIITIWAMDSVNINQIFKKNKVVQARVFYFLLGVSLIYLVTNFIMDLLLLENYSKRSINLFFWLKLILRWI